MRSLFPAFLGKVTRSLFPRFLEPKGVITRSPSGFLGGVTRSLFPRFLDPTPRIDPNTLFFLEAEPRTQGWPSTPENTLKIFTQQTAIKFIDAE